MRAVQAAGKGLFDIGFPDRQVVRNGQPSFVAMVIVVVRGSVRMIEAVVSEIRFDFGQAIFFDEFLCQPVGFVFRRTSDTVNAGNSCRRKIENPYVAVV